MNKIKYFVFLIGFFLSTRSLATDFNIFMGVGEAYQPTVVKLGVNNWEFGDLAGVLGFNKIFRNDWKYISCGLAFMSNPQLQPAFFASGGIETKLLWIFNFRAELFAFGGSNALVRSGLQLGLDLKF